jgi:hypothetical protein
MKPQNLLVLSITHHEIQQDKSSVIIQRRKKKPTNNLLSYKIKIPSKSINFRIQGKIKINYQSLQPDFKTTCI